MTPQALYRALLSAFPSEEALARMLWLHMNVKLAEIASGNLSDLALGVVRFAESRGRLDELLRAALTANPANPELRALTQAPATPQSEAADLAANHIAATVAPDKSALRRAIQDTYSVEELELLCADVQERLTVRGHQVRVSRDDVGGATKPAIVLNLVEFLDRRRLLPVLIEIVREQRPGRL